MSLKRVYEFGGVVQDSCEYAVDVFDGVSDYGDRLKIDKDDWREITDPHGWLVRTACAADGELIDRKIIVVEFLDQTRTIWMQLAPDDDAWNRHDYVTGWFDDNFVLQDATLRHGRYEANIVTPVEELERLRNNVISISKHITAGAVDIAA